MDTKFGGVLTSGWKFAIETFKSLPASCLICNSLVNNLVSESFC